jgi:RNA polymerase sigma-70 factor (ECF subfamily)
MLDSDAIRRLKNGDIGGLEDLVTRYQGKALRSAYFILQDEQLAEDVVQDTFIRIYQRIQNFDDRREFAPYLMRSVVNAALNAARQPAQVASIDDEHDGPILEDLLAQAASVESQVEFAQLKKEILATLSKLPPRQRAVIVQRYYLEMDEKDMVKALEIAPGTVRWLLSAARARLKGLLGAKGGMQ